MANLFGKNCNSDILNSEDEKKSYSKAIFSLKRDHIFAGNESAEAVQVRLDPDSFDIIPRTCNSPLLKIKTVDHGILSGLGDDDHSQYVHTSLTRQISADHEFTGNPVFSGSPQFSGAIKDSRGNIGADGLVPVITQAGKFEWGVVNLADYSHGDLSELDADDHLQYVHISENREVSADHSFSGDLDFTGDGSVALRGVVKDTNGNTGTEGQVPIARADGKFEWKSQDIENVFWVSKDGDDNNDGLSPQTAKASIKAAVRAAYSGVRGKLLDAAESILANKKFITEEVSGQLYTRNFTLPNSTPFDLKSRNAYKIILQNKNNIPELPKMETSFFKSRETERQEYLTNTVLPTVQDFLTKSFGVQLTPSMWEALSDEDAQNVYGNVANAFKIDPKVVQVVIGNILRGQQ